MAEKDEKAKDGKDAKGKDGKDAKTGPEFKVAVAISTYSDHLS